MYRFKKRLALTFIILPLITGCAFFNALYNGWKAFDKGMKTETELYRDGNDTATVLKATQSDYERSLKKAEKAVSFYPRSTRTHDDAYFLKGRSLFQLQRYAEAIPAFKALQESYPESKHIPQSWLYLGKTYAASGNYPMADETYTYIIDNFPELNQNQEILILKADLAVQMRGKAQAIVFLEEALGRLKDPAKRIYIIDRLGALYSELGMYEKALSFLEQKPVFDKLYTDLYYTASLKEITCHMKLNSFDKGKEILEELLKSRYYIRYHAELRFMLAELYLAENNIDEARDIFDDLSSSGKKDEIVAKSHFELAKILIDIDGNLEDGKVQLQKVVEITNDPELRSKAKKRLTGLEKVQLFSDSLAATLDDTVSEWSIRFKIGERYWLDAALPDSALVQYDMILEDTTVAESLYVKTLFSKAWILQEMKADTNAAIEIFNQIVKEYDTYAEAKEAQKLLDQPVTIMIRRDSAEVSFRDAEEKRLNTKGYDKDVYYSYLITAIKYSDIEDIAAKSLYAAGMVVNARPFGVDGEVDTAAAKIFGRLCKEYPESEQCKSIQVMLEDGQVKGFVDQYTEELEKEDSVLEEDSTALAQEIADSSKVEETLIPIEIPDFSDWF